MLTEGQTFDAEARAVIVTLREYNEAMQGEMNKLVAGGGGTSPAVRCAAPPGEVGVLEVEGWFAQLERRALYRVYTPAFRS
ncbi:MAG: hypothetical protein ACFCUG_01795 [Thiotrichales bacterium]